MKSNALSLSLLASLVAVSSARAAGFLSSGPGARAGAMGGAYTSIADDPSAMFYNPAGLAGQRGAISVEHVPINETGAGLSFGDGRLDFLGLQYPSRYGTFGVGVYQFAIGGIEGRQNIGDQATTLNVSQTAYFVPYGVQVGPLSLGVTGKVVNYSLAGFNGSGYGADAGAKAQFFHGDTVLGRDTKAFVGLAVRNAAAPKLKIYQDSTDIERVTSLGVSLSSKVREHYAAREDRVSHDQITLSLDFQKGNMGTPVGAAFGAEYAYLGRFAVRAGVSPNGAISVGVGASDASSKFRFDYAAGMTALAPQHHFSVSWFFTEAPAPVESDVRLSEFRQAVQDDQRLKDRYLQEGRDSASKGNYEDALRDFEYAQVLDPADKDVANLVASATEGNKLTGVKQRLDAARHEAAAHNDGLAAKHALDAVQFDPDSREAADFAVQLRNQMISTGTVASFNLERGRALEENTRNYELAYLDQNMDRLRIVIKKIRAVDPDDSAAWTPLLKRLFAAERDWCADYAAQAARAETIKDVLGMARAVRRIARINDRYPALRDLTKRLRHLAHSAGSTFYHQDYLRQLYDSAAADYVLGNYADAAQNLTVLLNQNAVHDAGNALIDRMRAEGTLSLTQEP